MPKTSDAAAQKGLPGRKAQAARNDGIILDAARAVFLADAAAPISAVAERAGVGISALYRRYPSKDVLLRTLCYDGLRRYNAEAEAALADSDPWRGLVGFLERVVDADVHSLTVRLAGTFTPDDSIVPDVQRSGELTSELVRRAHATGRLPPRGDRPGSGDGARRLRCDQHSRSRTHRAIASPSARPAGRRHGHGRRTTRPRTAAGGVRLALAAAHRPVSISSRCRPRDAERCGR